MMREEGERLMRVSRQKRKERKGGEEWKGYRRGGMGRKRRSEGVEEGSREEEEDNKKGTNTEL